jgi:uncharacterized protein
MERATIRSIILAFGVIIAGLFIGGGFAKGRAADRYVTVKGISEREVKADLAIWPIRLVAANNDLTQAHTQLQRNIALVRDFLARKSIDASQLALQDFSVTDAYANQYGSGERAANRYVIQQTIVIRSTRPDLILAASQQIAELVSGGVVLSSGEQYGNGGPTFVFTGLNQLKPKMIGEATARARESAQQFAHDSHSEIGGIRQASQGVFEILPRDQAQGITEASQIVKTVRVVSTIDYFLKN